MATTTIQTGNTTYTQILNGIPIKGDKGDGFDESNPSFTYTDGVVSRIDYLSGNYKVFTYVDSVLTQLDYVMGSTTKRKTFNWTNDGILANIVEIIL